MAFYRCDPEKNIFCRKKTCFLNNGPCHLTSNILYSENEKCIEDTAGGLSGRQMELKKSVATQQNT